MSRTINEADNYMSRVLKHIPSEIVMVYVAIEGVLRTSYDPAVWSQRQTLQTLLWIVFGVLTVLTPLWLWRVMHVRNFAQLLISTLSVPIWFFALGGPFALLPWYEPAFGAIVLPLYTLVVPIISHSA